MVSLHYTCFPILLSSHNKQRLVFKIATPSKEILTLLPISCSRTQRKHHDVYCHLLYSSQLSLHHFSLSIFFILFKFSCHPIIRQAQHTPASGSKCLLFTSTHVPQIFTRHSSLLLDGSLFNVSNISGTSSLHIKQHCSFTFFHNLSLVLFFVKQHQQTF